MHIRLVMVAALVSACGTSPDERPATLEVISLEILAPSCGQVQCHSTTTRLEGYAFDTYDASRDSLIRMNVGANQQKNKLLDVLEGREERMPPDSPLHDQDMALIHAWLDGGAAGLQ